MADKNQRVMAMYDVRGIQKYIFRTPHLKDAMGASISIDTIVPAALKEACVAQEVGTEGVQYLIEWDNKDGVLPYLWESKYRVEVLYIGGGNALVLFESEKLFLDITKRMAKYVLKNTYSLQLASTCVQVGGSDTYAKDLLSLYEKMDRVKAGMMAAGPVGALPIMKTELSTGMPAVGAAAKYRSNVSMETWLKNKSKEASSDENEDDKILDSYADKENNSRIAVVHIDGNNMGLRIRSLMGTITNYEKAVNRMRKISHSIKYAFLDTFFDMKQFYETSPVKEGVKRFVRKIVLAGDDITYICNGYIALDSVRYFAEKISGLCLWAENKENPTEEEIKNYGFSICAGIAYFGSHFPFTIAYETAESCCQRAKKEAKKAENKDGDRIGSYVDFQICKNIQTRNLKEVRQREYVTPSGEHLMLRPYYIPTGSQFGLEKNQRKEKCFTKLVDYIRFFSDENKIPTSMAKNLRNTYPLGWAQVEQVRSFLDSRGWKMPDGSLEMYIEEGERKFAKWYDALEIMDYNLFMD